ncbi:MAG: hypothetical protein Q9160_009358 [Pyrenula sp. 1 TL-2023]
MPSTSSQIVKLKSTLRLLIPRLRQAQKKDTALSITSRREMATLLSQNREASARIRVENIIQTDITVEVMEILELYAELLLARAGLIDRVKDEGEMDTGLEEASASIIYAAPRLAREIKELGTVRAMLVERWGKEFGARAAENAEGKMVPDKVAKKLKIETPSAELVQAYLEEIARAYGVEWPRRDLREDEAMVDAEAEVDRENQDDDDDEDGVGGGTKEQPLLADPAASDTASTSKAKTSSNRPRPSGQPFDRSELNRATPPKSKPDSAKSPISVAPPAPRTDNRSPSVKIPGGDEVKRKDSASAGKSGVVGGKIPDVDELAKRFKELKR